MRAFSCLFLLSFVLTIHLSACSTPPDPIDDGGIPIGACRLPFVGDPNAPMEVNIVAINPEYKLQPVEEGSGDSLMFPPQGGRVVFIGVRARNVNPCGVRLSAALRDPVTKRVSLDNRIINLQIAEDGYGQCDVTRIDTFANIPSCPNSFSSQDLMDVSYELTVSLTDKDDRKFTKILQVTPHCDEPGRIDECRCICAADYELGMACAELPDAGVSDAEPEDASAEPADASGD